MTDPTTDTSKKKSPTKQELEAFVVNFVKAEPYDMSPLDLTAWVRFRQIEALKLLAGVG